jgi:hypothetical protein
MKPEKSSGERAKCIIVYGAIGEKFRDVNEVLHVAVVEFKRMMLKSARFQRINRERERNRQKPLSEMDIPDPRIVGLPFYDSVLKAFHVPLSYEPEKLADPYQPAVIPLSEILNRRKSERSEKS